MSYSSQGIIPLCNVLITSLEGWLLGPFLPSPLGVSSRLVSLGLHSMPPLSGTKITLPSWVRVLSSCSLSLAFLNVCPVLLHCLPSCYKDSLRRSRRRGHLLASFWSNKSCWLWLIVSSNLKRNVISKRRHCNEKAFRTSIPSCVPFLRGQVSKESLKHALFIKKNSILSLKKGSNICISFYSVSTPISLIILPSSLHDLCKPLEASRVVVLSLLPCYVIWGDNDPTNPPCVHWATLN